MSVLQKKKFWVSLCLHWKQRSGQILGTNYLNFLGQKKTELYTLVLGLQKSQNCIGSKIYKHI